MVKSHGRPTNGNVLPVENLSPSVNEPASKFAHFFRVIDSVNRNSHGNQDNKIQYLLQIEELALNHIAWIS